MKVRQQLTAKAKSGPKIRKETFTSQRKSRVVSSQSLHRVLKVIAPYEITSFQCFRRIRKPQRSYGARMHVHSGHVPLARHCRQLHITAPMLFQLNLLATIFLGVRIIYMEMIFLIPP